MSNRYLFRGKRVDGIWVYGNLMMSERDRVKIQYSVGEGGYKDWISEYVIPETVGQCCWTLKDGTNVFKGDRVKVRGIKKVGVYETEITEDSQGFTLKENKTYLNDNRCFIAIIEVIGTIHD